MPHSSAKSRPLGTHMSIAGGLCKAIERAESVAATAVQIFTRNQKRWENPPLADEEAVAFRAAAPRLRYVCAHAGYLINLASPDEASRQRSLDALLDELERADRLGCDCLVLHPGSPKDDGAELGLSRVAEGLLAALSATPNDKVRIALENTAGQGSALGADVDELGRLLDLCDRDPRLTVCIDTAHAFAAGHDLTGQAGVDLLARTIDRRIGWDRVRVLHLNDATYACGSRRDRHEHIGKGQIGEAGFRRLLAIPELRCTPGILETHKDPKTLAEDIVNLRAIRRIDRA